MTRAWTGRYQRLTAKHSNLKYLRSQKLRCFWTNMVGDSCQLGALFFDVNISVAKTFKYATVFPVFWNGIQLLSTSLYRWFFVTEIQHCIDLKSWAVPVATTVSTKNRKSQVSYRFLSWGLLISKHLKAMAEASSHWVLCAPLWPDHSQGCDRSSDHITVLFWECCLSVYMQAGI